MSTMNFHNGTKPLKKINEDDEDPVETMIKKTGCLEKHHDVQVIDHRSKLSVKIAINRAIIDCVKNTIVIH